ncbi:hypothetical protein AKUA1202_04830 [Apilactobacillus kunkeei]|nr:hypothetical protein AKUA1802_04720 [Apilactobacillus kunkeei]CAI2580624.1 hypothetical protein AKUA0901_04720 [Apilactobacillus kunkeei]CAI2580986.1 hypothetical protein AKUA1201_04720 [Apilactobacillus kunkeei]CAI2581289.1 hypothetical protein AKUA1002_04720 [Apilactobacillus kunkeei]CAI2647082.1 hypothetical protein AKUA1803_04720 [Apilactobacillus kunkeei]
MDFENLTMMEVAKLIKQLKSFFTSKNLSINTFGKFKEDFAIIDKKSNIEYILHIYRGKYDIHKYSIHLRFKTDHEHLVRIDMHSGVGHNNSDNSHVGKNHIHILRCKNGIKENYAYELKEIPFIYKDSQTVDFNDDDDLYDTCQKFISFINLK